MTTIGWIQILLYCAIIVAITPVLGGYMTRVFNGERTFLSPVLRPVEAAHLSGRRRRRKARAALADLYGRHAAVPRRRLSHPLRADALAGARCRSIRPSRSAVAPDLSFNTAVSFITNTNWQNYGGESTLSYLVQMLGLTHQNFLSAATGIVLAVALIRGFARASAKTVGNFWVDITRCTLYILLPICMSLCAVPGLAGHAADARRLCRCDHARRRQADHRGRPGRLAGRDQDARHQWRRLLQRQCRASVRESDRAVEFRADHLDLRARRCAHQRVRPHGRQPAPGLGHPRRHGRAVHRRRGRLLLGRSQRHDRHARAGPHRRQHGRQGSPLRHRRLGAVRGDHHRGLLRRRQCHARLVHRARRHDPADQHPARRDHRRRRRRRPLRHAAVRHHVDLRRRPDGRPHAGICRQEDRGEGGQDGHARHPGPAADVSRLDGGRASV